MNQYLFLRRVRGPIFLLVFGITAILDEYTGIHYGMSWPLYIIVWGILKLAENAILAQNPPPPPGQIPGYPPGTYPPPPGYGAYPAGFGGAAWQPGYNPAAKPDTVPGTGASSGSNPPSTAIVPSDEERR
jgi:hypothetical protein